MSQTSYPLNQALAFAGMKADARFDEVVSYQADGAVAFGSGVIAGSNAETEVKIPAGNTTGFRGVAVHIHKAPVSGNARYEDTEMVSVLRKGRAWVPVVGTIAMGDAPRLIHTGGNAGAFTAGTTGSSAITGLEFASSYDTSSANAIALLDINLPQ